jgi:hypothetical protein
MDRMSPLASMRGFLQLLMVGVFLGAGLAGNCLSRELASREYPDTALTVAGTVCSATAFSISSRHYRTVFALASSPKAGFSFLTSAFTPISAVVGLLLISRIRSRNVGVDIVVLMTLSQDYDRV